MLPVYRIARSRLCKFCLRDNKSRINTRILLVFHVSQTLCCPHHPNIRSITIRSCKLQMLQKFVKIFICWIKIYLKCFFVYLHNSLLRWKNRYKHFVSWKIVNWSRNMSRKWEQWIIFWQSIVVLGDLCTIWDVDRSGREITRKWKVNVWKKFFEKVC